MTKLSDQIRTLAAAGKDPEAIARELGAEPKYVTRVLKRALVDDPANRIREMAEDIGYPRMRSETRRVLARQKIAAALNRSPYEVMDALGRSSTQGRPKSPLCEACGQPIRKKRNQDGNPSKHHIDNIEIRDAKEKTNG